MTEDEWVEKFKPKVNHIDQSHGWDFGSGCCLYETYSPEVDYVHQQAQIHPESVWTLIECDGNSYIIPGYHYVNRMGYFITENWHRGIDDNTEVECENLNDEEEEHDDDNNYDCRFERH